MYSNPFYVQPGTNLLPGLQSLERSIESYGEKRDERTEKARIEKIKQGAVEAYKSGDPDVIAEYAINNP